MKYYTTKKARSNDAVIDTVQPDTDYIDSNGNVYVHVKHAEVMVTSESDLTNLSGYAPSTIAYTAGLNKVWQLDASGNWVSII